jgi:hypothetical protein
MSTLIKAVLATTAMSIVSASSAAQAEPYCCRQASICDALCSSACCEKKLPSRLLTPVLPETATRD